MNNASEPDSGHHREIDLIVDEFTDRLHRRERVTIEDYLAAYPQHDATLREVLSPLVALYDSGESSDGTKWRPVPSSGDQLGDYTLIREIGRGGMAVVFEAVHSQLRRRVSLKILAGHLRDEVFVQRFEREARAAANLHHTHIIPVYEIGETDGIHYIAMQYIQGQSLDRALRAWCRPGTSNSGPGQASTENAVEANVETTASQSESDGGVVAAGTVPDNFASSLNPSDGNYFRAVARIGKQAADALEHAHQQGILHRDIKPSNLLIDENDNVWVADFGLAKLDDDDLTQTGDVLGTLRYMAAERFAGQCDARSDVYGLGITLYELLTLRPAFDQADRLQLMKQVSEEDPKPPRQVDSSIPLELDTIVGKAIAREPERRYQSARDLAEDFRRFLDDEPILAARLTVRHHLQRWCRRNPVPATLAALLIVSVVTGAGLFGWQFRETLKSNARLQVINTRLLAANERVQQANDELTQANEAERRARDEANENFSVNAAVTNLFAESFRSPDPAVDGSSITVASRLDEAVKRIKNDTKIDPVIRGALLKSIGVTFVELGLPKESVEVLELSDQQFALKLDPDSKLRVEAQSQLGFAYVRAGDFQKAIELLEPAVDSAVRAFGEHADETTMTCNHLATALIGAGQMQPALELLQPIHDYHRKHETQVTEASLQTANNLALALGAVRKLDEAITMLNEAVEGNTELFGPTDPRTLMTKSNLAVAYLNRGQPAKASPLIEETLRHRRSVLGDDHPETLMTENNLAGVFMMSGQFEKAVDAFSVLLPKMQAKLGTSNPRTLGVQYNLAGAFLRLKQPEKALPLFESSWDQMKSALGPNHPTTQKCYTNIGLANEDLARFDEAIRIAEEMLQVERKREPARPTSIAVQLDAIGRSCVKDEQHVKAEPLLREALALWEQHKPGQWQAEVTRSLLGECLSGQKKLVEAESCLSQSHTRLQSLEQQLPPHQRADVLASSARRLAELKEIRSNSSD
ncbi:MAG: serine/threonine-protein kinase [Planctomycetota bacterium]